MQKRIINFINNNWVVTLAGIAITFFLTKKEEVNEGIVNGLDSVPSVNNNAEIETNSQASVRNIGGGASAGSVPEVIELHDNGLVNHSQLHDFAVAMGGKPVSLMSKAEKLKYLNARR